MTPNPHDSASESLDAIIADYLKAVDAGSSPNRGQLLAAHPNHAVELQSFFHDLDRMNQLGDDPNATIGPDTSVGPGTYVRYFGDYELLEEVGRGGMGVVYRARQVSLNRPVALKMILAGKLASKADVQRFRTEAEAAANLNHPSIVPIYEVGELDGLQYFSMGHVEGGNLAERLEAGPLDPRSAADIVKTLAEAVQFAHEHGVIHRDLKPSNVLLDGLGRPKVTDFGLAKRMQKSDGPTITGDVLGTPAYMPPEQAAGTVALVGPLADVYSLGAILYACLTGRPPFQAATPVDTLLLVLTSDPEPPNKLRRGIPRDLVNICMKCLEKSLDRRYQSAQELADDLGRYLDGEPVKAKPPGLIRTSWVWARRRPWLLAELASLGMMFAILVAYGLRAEIRERGWTTLYWQARADRLALSERPDVSPAAIAQVQDLLQRADRVRHDPRLYEEALGLQAAARRGFFQVQPRTDGSNDPLPPAERSNHLDPFNWDQSGQKLLLPGAEFDAKSGRVSALKIGELVATADTTGGWLCAVDGNSQVRILHRSSGRERMINRKPAVIQHCRLVPYDRLFLLVASAEGEKPWRRMELWSLNDEQPPVELPVPAECALLYDFSADGSRLAWYSEPDNQINVCTTLGKDVAKISHSFGSFHLSDVALSPDGMRVVCCPSGWSGNELTSARIYDVATQQEVLRLPDIDRWTFIESVGYSADGRSIYGRSSRVEHIDNASRLTYRILIWDVSTAELRFWVRGDGFAPGSGANGELAVRRGADTEKNPGMALDVWQPAVVQEHIAQSGLTADMLRQSFDGEVQARVSERMWTYCKSWPTLIGGVACLILLPVQQLNAQKGVAAPVGVSAVAATAGAVTCVWMLLKLLAVFDLPQWSWLELMVYVAMSLLPLLFGTMALYQGCLNYKSAAFGENKSVLRVKSAAETARSRRNYEHAFYACFAAITLFVIRSAVDETVFVPHFGLIGALLFVMIASILLASLIAPLMVAWRWLAASRIGLSPRTALVGWTLLTVVAGLWCGSAIVDLVRQNAWQRLPPTDLTLNFELLLGKTEGNKYFFPTGALRDTFAAVTFALGLTGVFRTVRLRSATSQAAD